MRGKGIIRQAPRDNYSPRNSFMKYSLLLLVLIYLTAPFAKAQENQILTAGNQNAAEAEDDSFLPLLIPAIIAARNHGSEPWPDWPAAGNPTGSCAIPADAQEENSSNPDHIICDGTPQSCTSDAVVSTISQGGIIRFNCGPEPIIIQLNETAKIINNTGPKIVIDGGGKVALSGNNLHRILYMNTCDQNQVWTTPHCQNQDHPQLTVQNLVFLQGNSSSEEIYDGGGAIWARGGRLKIVNCRFFNNICASTGPDVGGAAVRAFSQYENLPLYVVNSTFGGAADFGNTCSNGGGLSSIGVSYSVINSLFSHNSAIGYGANPQRAGTPGGGSGGAIYNDGNTFDLNLCGTKIEDNSAREGGGAVFFVSNDRTGHLIIQHSLLQNNPSENFENYPGIFYLGDGEPQITDSTVQ
jgi:hypothetical protein